MTKSTNEPTPTFAEVRKKIINAMWGWGDTVTKISGGYSGPGIIRGCAVTEKGELRWIVSHHLVRAAALLIAEIERLDRGEAKASDTA